MNLLMKVAQRKSENCASAEDATRKKVLLVDDINIFIEIEKSVLARLDNFHILTAYSGAEALQIVEEDQPDLVIMDLQMGNMDGDECCRVIKEKYGKKVAVIMMTQGGSVDDFERCWASGCDDIIVKPINHYLFFAMAKKYLKMQPGGDIRHLARLKVKYGKGQQTALTDYSVNLSTGGLFLASKEILPIETSFAIEFHLPGYFEPICCQARVAWVNDPEHPKQRGMPAGMGLQFIDISLSDVHAIREYLSGGRLIPSW